ncbi:hypothetical protein EBR43_14305 [bacterium]|nr:hypothetical protein [bacterium]
MTFLTAEEATNITVPNAQKRWGELQRVVSQYLDSQAHLVKEAAAQGKFSATINPPSKEIINQVEELGYPGYCFHDCLRETIMGLGYRAQTDHRGFESSVLYWGTKTKE